MMPKDIQVKEGLGAGGTHQPHLQIVSVHMHTYGHLGGGWSLATPLNLAFINPFDTPTFRQRGVMWVVMATYKAWETAKGEPPVPLCLPQLQEWRVWVPLSWTPEGVAWKWWW